MVHVFAADHISYYEYCSVGGHLLLCFLFPTSLPNLLKIHPMDQNLKKSILVNCIENHLLPNHMFLTILMNYSLNFSIAWQPDPQYDRFNSLVFFHLVVC